MYCGEKIIFVTEIKSSDNNLVNQNIKERIIKKNKFDKNNFLYKTLSFIKKNITHLLFGGLVIFAFIVLITTVSINMAQTEKKSDNTQNNNNQTNNTQANKNDSLEDEEKELIPYNAYHGEIIIKPSYYRTCPFVVHTDEGENYYIYLKYIGAPSYSVEKREKNPKASNNENNISVYAVGGKTINIDVPIGKYEMYYCTGDVFYGNEKRFGDETRAYVADDILVFYVDDNYYQGNEITLYSVVNGNMDTSVINIDDFPK